MMHDPEKSDSAIVAEKSTNKAGQPAAEPMEPRAEAKGNADQQRTRRAQDRESVSQALDRIRQVAKTRKKEKRTTLFHHLNVPMLRTAFLALRREAAPGVDGLTWQDYEADLDRRIEALHARVQRGSVSCPAVQATVHSEARWAAAPARGRGPRGQDCPKSHGRDAECDLRGRFPRKLVRIPAGTRHARCAGCALRRNRQQEGELDTGRRHPIVLR